MGESAGQPDSFAQRCLLDLAEILGQRSSTGRMFTAFADRLSGACHANSAVLVLFEEDRRFVRVAGAFPASVAPVTDGGLRPERAVALSALPSDPEGLLLDGALDRCPGLRSTLDREYGTVWVGPLLDGDTVAGAVLLAWRAPVKPGGQTLAILRRAASMLGAAVLRDIQLDAARKDAARSNVLSRLAAMFNAAEPLERLFERLMPALQEAITFDYISLLVPAAEPGLLEIARAHPWLGPPEGWIGTPEDAGIFGLSAPGTEVQQYRSDLVPGDGLARLREHGITRMLSVTLQDGQEILGLLAIGRRLNMRYIPAEEQFLGAVGSILSQAISRQRQLDSIREAVSRAELEAGRNRLLSDIAIRLSSGQPIEALFDHLRGALGAVLPFDFLALTVRNSHDEPDLAVIGIEPREYISWGGRVTFEEMAFDPGRPVRTIVRLYDPTRVDSYRTRQMAAAGLHSATACILRDGDAILGLFTVARRDDRRFTPDERAFMEVLATLLAQSIGQRSRIARMKVDASRTELLNDLSLLLNDGEPVEALFARIPRIVGSAIAFDYAGIALATDLDAPALEVLDWIRDEDEPSGHRWVGQTALSLERFAAYPSGVFQFDPKPTDDAQAPFAALGLKRSAATVLRHRGRTLGAFHLARFDARPFSPEDTAFLDVVGTLLAQALSNQLRVRRSEAEAEARLVIAEAAALAAREPDRRALVRELATVLELWIPEPIVAFGFVDHDVLSYDDDTMGHIEPAFGRYARLALDSGQVAGDELPGPEGTSATVQKLRDLGAHAWAMTAARSAGQATGVLVVATRSPHRKFRERELRVFREIARTVGPALANALAARRAAEEALEQRIVAEVAAAAARESEPGPLVAAVLHPLRQLIPKPALAYGYLDRDEIAYPFPTGGEERHPMDALLWEAERTGQLLAPELPDTYGEDSTFRRLGVHGVCATVAEVRGATVGFLLTGSRQPGYLFGPRERRIFRVIAHIIGAAMENARAAQRAIEEARDQRIVAEVAAAASREPSETGLLRAVIQPLREVIPELVVGFAFIDGDHAVQVTKNGSPRLPLLYGDYEAIEVGQAVVRVGERTAEGHLARLNGIVSLSVTAHYVGGRAAGLFYAGTRNPSFEFTGRDLRIMQAVAGVVGPAMLTVRRTAEINRQRSLYRLMFGALSEGVIVLDHNQRVVFTNEPGRRLFAILDPERRLQTLDEHVAALPEPARSALRETIVGRQARRGRAELSGANEKPVWYDFEFVPLEDPNVSLLVIGSDATELVLREREEEERREQMQQASRLAALGELIGGVAHELNNPLTAILGFAELLAVSESGEPIAEELGIIQKEALRARNVVRDLLFIARPGQVEPARVDLREVMAHIERLRRNSWLSANIAVTVDIPPGCDAWGNENQVTQVLLNLVTNAEHALDGCTLREIHVHAHNEPGHVVIEVSDTGRGMDEATASRVFEPFFTTKQGQGTGLGLSLSYSIIRSHNGSIEAQSRPGEGTLFTVTLPAPIPAAAPPPELETELAPGPSRVLVIDDEPSLRKVCQRLVASMGHECDVAANSVEAIEFVRRRPYDAVICDYRLQSETADAVVPGIAALRPEMVGRIVIATGATTDAGVAALVARFGLRLIAKPYGYEDIARLIASVAAPPPHG